MPSVEVQGPDGNIYDFPDGTDKAAAIGYFKKKGIGVPKAAVPAPAGTPPLTTAGNDKTPMNEVELFTGHEHKPGGVAESVGNVLGGAAKSLADVSTPVI